MIQVLCAQCGLRILVPPTVQGKKGICFNCGHPLQVPTAVDLRRHLNLEFDKGDRVADRYLIEQPIGRGGMGVVYRAKDTLVGEFVALKFMLPAVLSTEKGQKLFISEAQIARRLRHDNIVAVHDVSWTNEGILYLSMELLEGKPLRDMLRQHRVDRRYMEVRLAVSITTQILAALEHAHQMVIHRDIKPENVMMLANERVKVLDFGLAKAVEEELARAAESPNARGKMEGTFVYAAPEQRRRQPIDQRADLYAVGLILHELLTLRTPMDEPVTVEKARRDVSPSIIAVLAKALAEDRDKRWQSARDFADALKKAFDDSYKRTSGMHIVTQETGRKASTENMAFLPGGSFLMGNSDMKDEGPEHEERVGPFWMDVYPVTVAEFRKYLEATGEQPPKFWRDPNFNGPNQPVIGVSWDQALAYARWAGKELPTEAQWEFAARGKDNRRYPWGNLPPSSTLANYNDFIGMTSMVSMHEDGRTPEGIYDLAGNIYEWTADAFLPYNARKLQTPPDEPRRTVRGGAYDTDGLTLSTSARMGLFPETQAKNVGFRCVIREG